MSESRPPVPPFGHESATQKVRMAEDAWNSRDPDRVVLVYTTDTQLWAAEGNRIAVRLFHWSLGSRPADHPSLSDLGL